MARPAASEETRIRKLMAALDRANARNLIGEALTFKPMCGLLQVSRPVLVDWLNEPDVASSGAFVPGSLSGEYRFDPIATIWVLIRHWERKRDAVVEKNMRIREVMAGDKLDGAPAEMSMADVSAAYGLSLKILTAEREAGKLIEASAAAAAMNEMVTTLREALLSSPQKLDPTNEWPPEFRERFDNALADCMVLLRQAGQETLSAADGPVPAGSDGPDRSASGRQVVRRSKGAITKRAGPAATA